MAEAADITSEEVRERLPQLLTLERQAHVERVAELARSLARIHGIDPDRAELAALLHDIAAGLSDEELLAHADDFGLPMSLTEACVPRLLHGRVGAEILRRDWHVNDEELLDAIRYHITGSPHMSALAKAVFVANKLEPNRDRYDGGLDPIRELAKISLDQALLRLYAWRMDELITHGQPVDQSLVASRNRLIEYSLATRRQREGSTQFNQAGLGG